MTGVNIAHVIRSCTITVLEQATTAVLLVLCPSCAYCWVVVVGDVFTAVGVCEHISTADRMTASRAWYYVLITVELHNETCCAVCL